jgi:hypothetical protein
MTRPSGPAQAFRVLSASNDVCDRKANRAERVIICLHCDWKRRRNISWGRGVTLSDRAAAVAHLKAVRGITAGEG